MTPLSIQLYTVRELTGEGRHVEVLRKIADIGYRGVEGAGYGLTPAEFRKLVEDMGMVVSSTWGDVTTPEGREKLIDAAQAMGVKNVVCGFWIPQFETVDAIAQTADILNEAIPVLREAGLTLSMHNHWMEFEVLEGKFKVDHLLERCPDLRLELDIYWAGNFGVNTPEELVAAYADRAPLLHVKDGTMVKGVPHVAVGSGVVDIPACIAASKAEWLIVELDECGTDMMEAVEQSYRYLVGNGLAAGNRPV